MIFIISILYIIYRIVLVFYLIKQFTYNLCTGKLLLRNYKLDPLAALFRVASSSLKTVTTFLRRQ